MNFEILTQVKVVLKLDKAAEKMTPLPKHLRGDRVGADIRYEQ